LTLIRLLKNQSSAADLIPSFLLVLYSAALFQERNKICRSRESYGKRHGGDGTADKDGEAPARNEKDYAGFVPKRPRTKARTRGALSEFWLITESA
jgi:hypothetical protein